MPLKKMLNNVFKTYELKYFIKSYKNKQNNLNLL